MHWRICTFERRVSSFHQLDVKAQRAIQNCLFAIHSIRGTRDVHNLHEQTSERWIVIVRDILCSSYTTLPRNTPRWKFTLIESHKMSIRYTKFATHTTYKLCYQSRRQKKNCLCSKDTEKSLKLSAWYMACCDMLEERTSIYTCFPQKPVTDLFQWWHNADLQSKLRLIATSSWKDI